MDTIQVHFILYNIWPFSLLFLLLEKPKPSVSVPTDRNRQPVEETQVTELGIGKF